MTPPRKLFIKTYGCQMNVYDSERMGEALSAADYQIIDNQDEADVVLLNTCHIREKAAEKVYSEIGRIRKKSRKNDKTQVIGVAGCVAQAEGEEMIKRAPAIDFVVGPQAYHRLPDLVQRVHNGAKVVEIDFPEEDKFEHLPARNKAAIARNPTAFLTVQEGCDKFCTFCVVPYTRGSEVSRPVSQIMDEAKRLVDAGVREITLLGQNVNAYHGVDAAGKEVNLGQLLFMLAELAGVARLRYTTSHPNDMHDELLAAHRDLPQLMPYLHLPVQSGSDRILKAMNRKHTRDDYFRYIEAIRAVRPDLALSGDFIIGFPGEEEADVLATLDLVEKVGYAQAFSFKYSPRPGTPASSLGAQVAEEVKSERLQRLQQLLSAQQLRFNMSMEAQTVPVLLERKGREQGFLMGRSPYLQVVQVEAVGYAIGQMVDVQIVRASPNTLYGKTLHPHPQAAE